MTTTPGTDVAAVLNDPTTFDDRDLRAIEDWNSVLTLFQDREIAAEEIGIYGTGFKVLSRAEKDRLCGVPFMLLEWRFNKGDYRREDENGNAQTALFVSAMLVTKAGEKYIINDGGTGVCQQLVRVTDERRATGHPRPQVGLFVPDGLTRSDYTGPNGDPATTYYLSE